MSTAVTMISQLTGKRHTMEMSINFDKLQGWRMGILTDPIQDIFPELSSEEREFLMTGITPDEWDTLIASPCDKCGQLKIAHRDNALQHDWVEP